MKKNPSNQSPSRSKAQQDPNMRPENKDNLDSRINEEQEFNGDDVTHNQKPHSNKHPHKKK